jgi:hypothetical protein
MSCLLLGVHWRWTFRSTIFGVSYFTRTGFAHQASTSAIATWSSISPHHAIKDSSVHSGFASSHFFFRLRHVPQPVLVRCANGLFLVATPIPALGPPSLSAGVCGTITGGMLLCPLGPTNSARCGSGMNRPDVFVGFPSLS